ncbi:conserved hypothetical protein, secreted [Candidatus Magnetomorum sp. HK-1]|nr:conserved hypothetical protein, secreted [Candidatus Magnetomorum sp. HK-1]
MKSNILAIVTAIVLSITSIAAGQSIPQKISIQGKLNDANSGRPLTDIKKFIFKIGEWVEEHANVKVNNGMYSVILGSFNSIPLSLFNDWQANLKILVDGKEISPDIEMLSVPYAFKAQCIDNVYVEDNKVGIGVVNPKYSFHVKGPSVFSGNIGFVGTDPSANIVTRDGFRFKYDNNFFGTNLDAMIFEKTDGNQGRPDGGIAFVNRGSYGDDGSPITAMVIKGDGKIGIGTKNPMGKLHIRNLGDESDQYSGLKFYPATSAKKGINIQTFPH